MMAESSAKTEAPESLNEEYYQINPEIIGSFPKYRPPLNIYKFKEDVARIMVYFKVGDRLSNEQVEELAEMTKQGLAFVSRDDHKIYVKHISYQLDLVLVDKNLKEREIADIFMEALTMRIRDFLDQPVKPVFEKLHSDIQVLTEYLYHDIHKARGLFRRLKTEEPHNLVNHSVNTAVTGLAIFSTMYGKDFETGKASRKLLDGLTLGLFLHDLGMTKIPSFILSKTKPLTGDERTKVLAHPTLGLRTFVKLDLRSPEAEACIAEHHERLDGSGYPQKKTSKEIALVGMICAVADSFSAMVVKRPNAEAMSLEDAARALAVDKKYSDKITMTLQTILYQMKQRGQL